MRAAGEKYLENDNYCSKNALTPPLKGSKNGIFGHLWGGLIDVYTWYAYLNLLNLNVILLSKK